MRKPSNAGIDHLYGDNPVRDEFKYDPPFPTSLIQFKNEKGQHSTQKPTTLMEWIWKYYSKEGDTVLDPTTGSGSMGVACTSIGREFKGIEKDEIYKVACDRLGFEKHI